MSLGERIYMLRTEKNLSQGDLAEMLEVSRQSISKWENNSAIPDLEKIIKLSDIFGVSLDELVKGEVKPQVTINAAPVPEPQKQEAGFPPRKIAGTILLCMGFLVTLAFLLLEGGLAGLIFAIPFLLCGIICFAFKENVGLWCSWAVYFCVDAYLRWATGITPGVVLYSFYWTADMNYARLATGWGLFLGVVLLVVITVCRLRKKPITVNKASRNKLIALWSIFVVLSVSVTLLSYLWSRLLTYILSSVDGYRLMNVLLDWCRIIIFAVALTNTVRYYRCLKMLKKNS